MKIAVAGLGYTGKTIVQSLTYTGNTVYAFSANSTMEGSSRCDFKKGVQEWHDYTGNFYDSQLVTFPLHELAHEQIKAILSQSRSSFLFSSTGIFKRDDLWIHENSPKDISHKRYRNEAYWLEQGGSVIYLAGIYGPGRNPVDWILKGKVQNSIRQLNLIHIDDITTYTTALLLGNIATPPRELILSDGQIHAWRDIFSYAANAGLAGRYPEELSTKENAFCNSALMQQLFMDHRPCHFWHELAQLNPKAN